MKCPNCGQADLKRREIPFVQGARYLGDFVADVCPVCGEILFTEDASERINARAQELGLWGKPLPNEWTWLSPSPNEEDRLVFPVGSWLEKSAETRASHPGSAPRSKVSAIRLSASTA